jgi:phosphatidylserine/phosphatidylglycerophosphate/cardiolipin synthase-like enzyme
VATDGQTSGRGFIEPLPRQRRTVGLWGAYHLTVHAKLVLVDDVFTAVGSANFFSRSMAGVDTELTIAVGDHRARCAICGYGRRPSTCAPG